MQRDKISRFWDKYIIKLMDYNVSEQYRRWYVKRVEAYIKAHPELPLKHHTEEILTKYLNDLGRNERLQVWQFKQSIEALRISSVRLRNCMRPPYILRISSAPLGWLGLQFSRFIQDFSSKFSHPLYRHALTMLFMAINREQKISNQAR